MCKGDEFDEEEVKAGAVEECSVGIGGVEGGKGGVEGHCGLDCVCDGDRAAGLGEDWGWGMLGWVVK